jgi:hypothetical protein
MPCSLSLSLTVTPPTAELQGIVAPPSCSQKVSGLKGNTIYVVQAELELVVHELQHLQNWKKGNYVGSDEIVGGACAHTHTQMQQVRTCKSCLGGGCKLGRMLEMGIGGWGRPTSFLTRLIIDIV